MTKQTFPAFRYHPWRDLQNEHVAMDRSSQSFSLQILNFLVDKFDCWGSRNEMLVVHYKENIRIHHYEENIRIHHILCLILRKLWLTSNISNINLYSVSNWVEKVSLIMLKIARIKNKLREQIHIWNCLY